MNRERNMAKKPSLLDDLGEEVTGIIAPVSLCMAVTVLLVRLLNPEGASSSSSVLIANIAYQEQASDTAGKKLGGALLNAVIFVAVIGGMTIILFLLFKFKLYKFIYAYMGFAIFNIFFFLTGALFIQVMQVIHLHIDAFSLAYGLLNFSVVGTIGLLFVPIPLLMKQLYLIWVGIIVAYIFTWIPEWTAWVLLVLMALYDIAAVLIPGGPLKALVELAIERKQDLPALIYEARPAGGRPYVRGFGNRTPAVQPEGGPAGGGAAAAAPVASRPVAEGAAAAATAAAATSASTSLEMRRPVSRPGSAAAGGSDVRRGGSSGGAMSGGWVAGPSRKALTAQEEAAMPPGGGGGGGGGREVVGGHAGSGGDAIRSFSNSQRGVEDLFHQHQHQHRQQQQQAPSGGQGAAGNSDLGGPRPVAEGRELEAWERLTRGSSEEEEGGPRGGDRGGGGMGTGIGGGGCTSLRERLSRVLSASHRETPPAGEVPAASVGVLGILGGGRGGGGGGGGGSNSSSSHAYQERLIQSPRSSSTTAATASPERYQQQQLQPRVSGAGPVAAVVVGGAGGGSGGFTGAGSSPLAGVAGTGTGSLREGSSTMGVRAVAPALSQDVLEEAVRRSIRNLDNSEQTPARLPPSATPAAAAGTAGWAAADPDNERRRSNRDVTEGGGGTPPREGAAFEPDLPDAIKLGLGDFIFYSMLVGRAAMYDFMTVFSSYLAIIAGLGLTLLCLAIYQKALPALPFSIALGVAFYFLTRFTLEPFLVPMVTHLAYY